MTPKTPEELKEQIERENAENPPAEGHDRTAEGLEVERPSREDFFDNLEQVSRPDDQGNGEKATKPEKRNG